MYLSLMRLWAGLRGVGLTRRLVSAATPRAADGGTPGGGGTPAALGGADPAAGGGGAAAAAAAPRSGAGVAARLAGWCRGGGGGGGGGGGDGGGWRASRATYRAATLVVLAAAAVGSMAVLGGGAGGGGGGGGAARRRSWRLASLLPEGVRPPAAVVTMGGGGGERGGGVRAAAVAGGRRAGGPDAGATTKAPPGGADGRAASGGGGSGAGGGDGGSDGRVRGRNGGTGVAALGGGVDAKSPARPLPPPSPPPPRPSPPPPPPRHAPPVPLTVYFHNRVGWERSYIESLLFGPAVAVTRVSVTTDELQGTAGKEAVVGRRPPRGATALVINAMWLRGSTPAQRAAFGLLLRRLSPTVSVLCSDERGQAGWVHATMVAHSTTTLRQYGVYTYANDTAVGGAPRGRAGARDGGRRRTSHAIPLGYMIGMFDGNYTARRRAHANATVPASRRPYAWAFPTKLHGKDREPMLAAFRSWTGAPHRIGPGDVAASRAAYEAAAFVPNSHGNVVLDCFRLYEASMAGAIPVLVASRDEFRTNFGALPALPPWVVAPDWAAALATVRELAANRGALDARQRAVSEWWWRVNDVVRQLVEDTVVGRVRPGERAWKEAAGR